MNIDTFKKRVQFAFTRRGELKKEYLPIMEYLSRMKVGDKVYPKRWSVSSGYANLKDNSKKLEQILDSSKLEYEFGNDSPRNGLEGDFYKLSKKGLINIKNLKIEELWQI